MINRCSMTGQASPAPTASNLLLVFGSIFAAGSNCARSDGIISSGKLINCTTTGVNVIPMRGSMVRPPQFQFSLVFFFCVPFFRPLVPIRLRICWNHRRGNLLLLDCFRFDRDTLICVDGKDALRCCSF